MNWLLRRGAGNVRCGTRPYPGLLGACAGVEVRRGLTSRDAGIAPVLLLVIILGLNF